MSSFYNFKYDVQEFQVYDEMKNIVSAVDFSQIHHMIVVGDSKTGKTSFVQSMLYEIVKNKVPSCFFIYDVSYFDYKYFDDAPVMSVRVKEEYELSEFFENIRHMIEFRLSLLTEYNYGDINSFIEKAPYTAEIYHAYVVIDEINNFKNYKEDIEYILSKGRRAGVHLIWISSNISTTKENVGIISRIPFRVLFRTSDVKISRMIIERSKANSYYDSMECSVRWNGNLYRGTCKCMSKEDVQHELFLYYLANGQPPDLTALRSRLSEDQISKIDRDRLEREIAQERSIREEKERSKKEEEERNAQEARKANEASEEDSVRKLRELRNAIRSIDLEEIKKEEETRKKEKEIAIICFACLGMSLLFSCYGTLGLSFALTGFIAGVVSRQKSLKIQLASFANLIIAVAMAIIYINKIFDIILYILH